MLSPIVCRRSKYGLYLGVKSRPYWLDIDNIGCFDQAVEFVGLRGISFCSDEPSIAVLLRLRKKDPTEISISSSARMRAA